MLAPGALATIGVWGGPDIEARSDNERFDPPRFFSRRSDDRWRTLLGAIGAIERYETWGEGRDDFWYQFAVLRVDG